MEEFLDIRKEEAKPIYTQTKQQQEIDFIEESNGQPHATLRLARISRIDQAWKLRL
jgi:hypothetical protein